VARTRISRTASITSALPAVSIGAADGSAGQEFHRPGGDGLLNRTFPSCICLSLKTCSDSGSRQAGRPYYSRPPAASPPGLPQLFVGGGEILGQHARLPTTVMKLASPIQRGSTCMWMWRPLRRPRTGPGSSPHSGPGRGKISRRCFSHGRQGHQFRRAWPPRPPRASPRARRERSSGGHWCTESGSG